MVNSKQAGYENGHRMAMNMLISDDFGLIWSHQSGGGFFQPQDSKTDKGEPTEVAERFENVLAGWTIICQIYKSQKLQMELDTTSRFFLNK